MTNARTAKSAREKAAELRAEAQKKEARRRNLLVVLAVVGVLIVVGAIVTVVKIGQNNAAAAAAPPPGVTDNAITVGYGGVAPLGATSVTTTAPKVTITMYEDFQCPFCAQFEKAQAEQLTKWATDGTAKLVYKPVAFLDGASTTNYSTRALNALAAVLAADPSKFPAFHKLLFDNQPPEQSAGLTDAQLIDFAVKAGVTKSAVESAITSQKYVKWTEAATKAFAKDGYSSTPTVLINGKQVPSGDTLDPAKLKAAVEAAAK